MKFTCALAAGLALSLLPARHELRYAPEPGAVLAREISWTLETGTVSTSTTLGGEATAEVPDLVFDATRTVEVAVVDTIEAAVDGRPTRLLRAHGDLFESYAADLTLSFGEQEAQLEVSGDGTSPLEGGDVRFTWTDGAYEAAWADDDEERDAALLEGLAADMDLLALLPGGAVEVGDEWSVDPAALAGVLFPGGDLGLELETDLDRLEGALDPADLPGPAAVLARGELEGQVTCTLEAVEDGLARVTLRVEVDARASFVDELGAAAGAAAPEDVTVELSRADFALMLEGEGTLHWDIAAGHARALEFAGDIVEESETAAVVGADGQDMEFLQLQERAGRLEVRYAVE